MRLRCLGLVLLACLTVPAVAAPSQPAPGDPVAADPGAVCTRYFGAIQQAGSIHDLEPFFSSAYEASLQAYPRGSRTDQQILADWKDTHRNAHLLEQQVRCGFAVIRFQTELDGHPATLSDHLVQQDGAWHIDQETVTPEGRMPKLPDPQRPPWTY